MKHIIKDKELVQYVMNNMTADERGRLEQTAIENGETDLLLHSILAYYQCNAEYADELLGEDTFIRITRPLSFTHVCKMPKAADKKKSTI